MKNLPEKMKIENVIVKLNMPEVFVVTTWCFIPSIVNFNNLITCLFMMHHLHYYQFTTRFVDGEVSRPTCIDFGLSTNIAHYSVLLYGSAIELLLILLLHVLSLKMLSLFISAIDRLLYVE
jgi:hypothetical protein